MGFLSQLFTAWRGLVTDAGETIVDTQAIRILEQKVSDAKKPLNDAKENLAKLIAEQLRLERNIKRNEKTIRKYESYTIQLLDLDDEKMAEKIAIQIVDLEYELSTQQKLFEDYNSTINSLNQHIREAERQIKLMEHEISVVKTTERVQKANLVATTNALDAASESLERIKNKQQQKSDKMEAAMELEREKSGRDLEAGIMEGKLSSYLVLERIKAKRAEKTE